MGVKFKSSTTPNFGTHMLPLDISTLTESISTHTEWLVLLYYSNSTILLSIYIGGVHV